LFAIDPFTTETGGTIVLPHSHRHDTMPSENYLLQHATQITASAGSVLIFDAMVFHRAGVNRSSQIRRGVNHLYTIPLLKQQYDFPAVLGESFSEDPAIRRLLGYDSRVPKNALEWRRDRVKRLAATQRQQ
jgi:ectoine hydroxylase-related dioxygenase (phytanoyl-CoA dioxygenase family)